jgi:hypothetical protein
MTPSEWAKNRNWTKLRLSGCAANITNLAKAVDQQTLTPLEKSELRQIGERLNLLLKGWNVGTPVSKEMYCERTKPIKDILKKNKVK